MRWRHHESIHAGLRIWEIWTPELLWPAHVEAARNRRSRVSDRAPNAAPERRRSPPWPQRRTARRLRSCDRLAASNLTFGNRTRQSRAVDLAYSETDLDLRPDRSDGAIWTASAVTFK